MPRRRYSRGYARTRRRYGGRASTLTGGTGDVNPQWFNIDSPVNMTDANPVVAQGVSAEYVVPIVQSSMMKAGRNSVMEILKVQFYVSGTMGTVNPNYRVGVTTRSTSSSGGDLIPTKPHVLAATAFTALACLGGNGAAAGTQFNCTYELNLTDEAGHGVIFAGQKLYLGIESTAASGTNTTPATTSVRAKLLYRWKNVSMTEYIGVVTSQLSA